MPTPVQIAQTVRFNEAGLVPVIAQERSSGEVLMLAWMNAEALERTISTGRATYFSRSRDQLWEKGETSGNRQIVREMSLDCDQDTVLITVDQTGPACHTNTPTCFTDRQVPLATGSDQ